MSATVLQPPTAKPPAPTISGAGPQPLAMRWTVEQFNQMGSMGWFEGRRPFLLDGVIWEQGPMNPLHANALYRMSKALDVIFTAGWVVRVQLPMRVDNHDDPFPDLLVVAGGPDDFWTAHPATASLVVEVSDTTLKIDITEKAERYATANVADYWVLDLVGRRLFVFRDPQPFPAGLGSTAYRTQLTLAPTDRVSPLAASHMLPFSSQISCLEPQRLSATARRDLDRNFPRPYWLDHTRRDATAVDPGTWGTFDDFLPPCPPPNMACGRYTRGPRAGVAWHFVRGRESQRQNHRRGDSGRQPHPHPRSDSLDHDLPARRAVRRSHDSGRRSQAALDQVVRSRWRANPHQGRARWPPHHPGLRHRTDQRRAGRAVHRRAAHWPHRTSEPHRHPQGRADEPAGQRTRAGRRFSGSIRKTGAISPRSNSWKGASQPTPAWSIRSSRGRW